MYPVKILFLVKAYISGKIHNIKLKTHKLDDFALKNIKALFNESGEQRNKEVPLVFQFLWANLTRKKLLSLFEDKNWRELEGKICSECFCLVSNNTLGFSGVKKQLREKLKTNITKDTAWLADFVRYNLGWKLKVVSSWRKSVSGSDNNKSLPKKVDPNTIGIHHIGSPHFLHPIVKKNRKTRIAKREQSSGEFSTQMFSYADNIIGRRDKIVEAKFERKRASFSFFNSSSLENSGASIKKLDSPVIKKIVTQKTKTKLPKLRSSSTPKPRFRGGISEERGEHWISLRIAEKARKESKHIIQDIRSIAKKHKADLSFI